MSRRYFLVVRHRDPHVAGVPGVDRCCCAQRERLYEGAAELEAVDVHDFIGPMARERYEVQYVDPECQTTKIDSTLDVSLLIASVRSEPANFSVQHTQRA